MNFPKLTLAALDRLAIAAGILAAAVFNMAILADIAGWRGIGYALLHPTILLTGMGMVFMATEAIWRATK